MKYALGVLIIVITALPMTAFSAPCAYKLLKTDEVSRTTNDFTMYVELLLNRRVLSLSELQPFFSELKNGKLTNPIQNPHQNLTHSIHHEEFEHFLKNPQLEITEIQKWATFLQAKLTKDTLSKEAAEKITAHVPTYIAPDGSQFHKFTLPKIGEVYKILKPKGHFENPKNWQKTIWPVHPLKTPGGKFRRFRHSSEEDSDARRGCQKIKRGLDVPTKKQYTELLGYFPHMDSKKENLRILTAKGVQTFLSVFPDADLAGAVRLSNPNSRERYRTKAWFFNGTQIIHFVSVNFHVPYAVHCVYVEPEK